MTGLTGKAKAAPVRAAVLGLLAALFVAAGLTPAADAADWRVTLRGHAGNPGETPVVAEVRAAIPPGRYRVVGDAEGVPVQRAQVFVDAGKTYLGLVLKHLPAGGTVSATIAPDDTKELRASGVSFGEDKADVTVFVGGKPFTVYHTGLPAKPYYYPLVGPTGASFTRAYPMKPDVAGEDRDHPHQRSFWFTHGSVNGVDFWASDPLNKPKSTFGSIKETSRTVVASGPAVGVLRTTDDWVGPDGKKVCEDERTVRVYATSDVRIIDFDITLKAVNGPVTFGDTKEGMFGLRVASSMDVQKKAGGKITNAEGVTDDDAWGKASPWVDYTGPVEGKTVGVAILNHPGSFRYPTTWHVRTYGLFAANPFGWHDFGRKQSGEHVVPAGGSIRFGYRVILHEGDTAAAHLSEAFKAYAEPPTVEVTGG